MNVTRDYLKSGQGARPGKRLTACRGLGIHWIGAPQGHAALEITPLCKLSYL